MKLRHPVLIRLVSIAAVLVIRAWSLTLRKTGRFPFEGTDPMRTSGPKAIYAFWHDGMLLPAVMYGRSGAAVLISRHADGELIAQVVRRLGLNLVRGSSSRGGARAMLEIIRDVRDRHIVFTPDGPRGPRHEAHAGIAFLAAVTGMPVIPIGVGYQKAWRVNSWDRFAIPKPFSRACCHFGAPIYVSRAVDPASLESVRRRIQEAMLQANRMAESAASDRRSEALSHIPVPSAKPA